MPKFDGLKKCRTGHCAGGRFARRHGHLEQLLAGDCSGSGERSDPESLIGIEQHADGEPADMSRQQKLDERAERSEEPWPPRPRPRVNRFQQQFRAVSGGERDQRRRPGLLEAEHGVAENVERCDGNCKPPQPRDPLVLIPIIRLDSHFCSLPRQRQA